MLFNSLQFLVFFPGIVMLYFMLPVRLRWLLLLAGSYYFYMCFKPAYIVLILFSTLTSYITALQMARQQQPGMRRVFLLLSLGANLGLLFFFKYFNLFSAGVHLILDRFNFVVHEPTLEVLLPIGISFYTFQTLSYTIDVYRGERQPESHLGIFALYVSFFPQLVAGPIERSTHLLPQFYRQTRFDRERAADGLKLMCWGFFKKLVIADRLSIYVNQVYNHPSDYIGAPLILGTYFFAIQIYCDFSGYSDIAVGSARVLGYDLMENFRRPYFARSIAEFWRRWHISLSTWFRDYLYVPLGGNRVSAMRWQANIMIVFLLCGLWHGAHPKFVVWGGLHGLYLLGGKLTARPRRKLVAWMGISRYPRIYGLVQIFVTFHLVTFAWIFFRANSFTDAFVIIRHMGDLFQAGSWHVLVSGKYQFLVALAGCCWLLGIQLIQRRWVVRDCWSWCPVWLRWPAYYGFLFILLIMGNFSSAEFIYFQF